MFGLVHLVHPVEDGMAGVQLDGGEDGLTSRGGGRGGNGGGSNVGGIGSRCDGVGNRGNLGRPPGASDHTVTEVVGDVGHAVVAGLVHVGVAAGDTVAVGGSALLGGVVDVLVTVSSVARLVLGPVLAAGHLGSNGSNSGHSRSSSNGDGSGGLVSSSDAVVGGGSNTVGAVGSLGSVTKASSVGNGVLGGGGCQGGGEQNLRSVN